MTLDIIVSPTDRAGLYRAELDGRHLVTARTPFLAAARVLLAEGVPPETRIAMLWAGSEVDAMRSTVGAAAELAVADDDRGVRFIPYRANPFQNEAGSVSGIAPGAARATAGHSGAWSEAPAADDPDSALFGAV